MQLSSKFLKTVTTKLDLKTSELKKKQLYIDILIKRQEIIKDLKKMNEYKRISFNYNQFKSGQALLICHILIISFSRSNTTIQLTDTKGNLKIFLNAGSTGFRGKQKNQRKQIINRLTQLLISKTTTHKKIPVAVHFKNVKSHKSFILEKLQNSFFIRAIKSFDKIPHNGCRKSKIRRKKNSKITKR